MKKRLIAFFLMLVMVMGSTAVCTAQTNSFKDTVKEIQQIKTGTYSYELNFKANFKGDGTEEINSLLKDLYIKMDGQVSGTALNLNMQYKLSKNGTYADITDFVFDGKAFYVNIKKIGAFLTATKDQALVGYATLLSTATDKTYVKVSEDDKSTILSIISPLLSAADQNVETSDLIDTQQSTEDAQMLYTIIENSVKDIKPAIVSEKDGVYTFSINNKNAVKFLTKLKKNIDESNITNENVKDLSTELKTLITEMKKDKISKYSLVATLELTGTEGSRIINQTVTLDFSNKDIGSINYAVNGSINENAAVTVTAPTDFITFTELYTKLSTVK